MSEVGVKNIYSGHYQWPEYVNIRGWRRCSVHWHQYILTSYHNLNAVLINKNAAAMKGMQPMQGSSESNAALYCVGAQFLSSLCTHTDQWPPTSLHNKDEEWKMKGNSCISKFLFHGHLEKDLWYSLHQAAALQSLCSKDLIRILSRHAALHSPYFTTTHNIKLVRNAHYWELKIFSDCVSTLSWNCEGLWQ